MVGAAGMRMFDRFRPWMFRPAYLARVQITHPIAYWPLNEDSGTTAYDRSGNAYNGAHSNVTLGQTGIGDGNICPLYVPASASLTNLYSAGFAGAFNGQEGTVAQWLKVANAGVWTDGGVRIGIRLYIDGDNRLAFAKTATNNIFQFLYGAGGITRTVEITTSRTDWFHAALTWSLSANQVKAYINGIRTGTTQAVGTWAGTPHSSYTLIGAGKSDGSGSLWSGWVAHAAYWNRPLTPSEIYRIGRL